MQCEFTLYGERCRLEKGHKGLHDRDAIPDYSKRIAEDDATLRRMQAEQKEWRTVIDGLPIIRKLLNGEEVELADFRINLIPDDVLFNNKPCAKA